jgi:hypothetical protein
VTKIASTGFQPEICDPPEAPVSKVVFEQMFRPNRNAVAVETGLKINSIAVKTRSTLYGRRIDPDGIK